MCVRPDLLSRLASLNVASGANDEREHEHEHENRRDQQSECCIEP